MIKRALLACLLAGAASAFTAAAAEAQVSRHDLRVRLQPETGRLFGEGELRIERIDDSRVTLRLAPGFALQNVRYEVDDGWRDAVVGPGAIDAMGRTRWSVSMAELQGDSVRLQLAWAGVPGPMSEARARAELGVGWRYLNESGAMLSPTGGWYPTASQETSEFRLEVTAPKDWVVVSSAEPVVESAGEASSVTRFEIEHPVPGAFLVAGPWSVSERKHRGGSLALYHDGTAEEPAVRRTLLEMRRQVDALIGEAGPWSWQRLSVVQHPVVGGLHAPGIALIGPEGWGSLLDDRDGIRRVVARAWWPGTVYAPSGPGTGWGEALADFVAEHRLRAGDDEQQRRELRRQRLWTVLGSGDARHERAVMAFAMLERKLGAERFGKALRSFLVERRYRVTGWSDVLASFERSSGTPLTELAERWLEVRELPRLEVRSVRSRRAAAGSKVAVALATDPAWNLDVPVDLRDAEGRRVQGIVPLRDGSGRVTMSSPFVPEMLRVDPQQRLMRQLSRSERAPRLGEVNRTTPQAIVIGSARGGDLERQARHLGSVIGGTGVVPRSDREISPEQLSGQAPVLILGRPGGAWRTALEERLPEGLRLEADRIDVGGRSRTAASTAVAVALSGEHRTWVLVDALSPAALQSLVERLEEVGRHSWALLEGDTITARALLEPRGPFQVPIDREGGSADE